MPLALLFIFILSACVKYEAGTPPTTSTPAPVVAEKSAQMTTHTLIFLIESPFQTKIGDTSCGEFSWLADKDWPYQKNEKINIHKSDISLFKTNPAPLDVIESLNVFSEDILPKKIAGEMKIGAIPFMLLSFAKHLSLESDLKITNVVSVKKIAGQFVSTNKTDHCETQASALYGAALSIAMNLRFQTTQDKISFQKKFGDQTPFMSEKILGNDKAISDFLTQRAAEIDFSVAQLGGDVQKTKIFVSQITCSTLHIDDCRKARHSLFEYFFNEELAPPETPSQTNGWVAVQSS